MLTDGLVGRGAARLGSIAVLMVAIGCGARKREQQVHAGQDPSTAPSGASSDPTLDHLRLPPGFAIEVYTDKVPNARSLALGPDGVVFVGSRDAGRVYAVLDRDLDREVDEVITLLRGLDSPNGVDVHNGDLYVAESTRILRFPDIMQHLDDPPAPTVVSDVLPREAAHGWRYMKFGPDDWLYVGVGAPCNVCLREQPVYASITRMRPDGSDLETFASGVRNSVGFDWHPETGVMWFTDNGRDGLGDNVPADELNRAPTPGLHFGFPFCHAGQVLDPKFGEGRSCDEFVAPVMRLGPHVAALGMRFYTGDMFPAQWHNAVIIAEHGSWDRSEPIGYRVMAVPLTGSKPIDRRPLVEGFLDQQTGEVRGRPVDVAVLADGSLLVSDDYGGTIYRVTYQ